MAVESEHEEFRSTHWIGIRPVWGPQNVVTRRVWCVSRNHQGQCLSGGLCSEPALHDNRGGSNSWSLHAGLRAGHLRREWRSKSGVSAAGFDYTGILVQSAEHTLHDAVQPQHPTRNVRRQRVLSWEISCWMLRLYCIM